MTADRPDTARLASRKRAATVAAKLARMPVVTRLTVGFALLALPAAALLADRTTLTVAPLARYAYSWGVVLVVVVVTVRVENRSFASLGFRRPAWRDIGYLLGTAVLMFVAVTASDPLVRALGLPLQSGAETTATETGLGVALFGAITTGVVEELLYRGYSIERLLAYSDSPALAGALTVGVFTGAHAVVWPLGNVVTVAIGSVVLTAVYLHRRTLVPVIGAHTGVWIVAALGEFYG